MVAVDDDTPQVARTRSGAVEDLVLDLPGEHGSIAVGPGIPVARLGLPLPEVLVLVVRSVVTPGSTNIASRQS